MHPIDEVKSIVGCASDIFSIPAGLMCSAPFVYWFADFGVGFLLTGLALDKWREWKRAQKEKVWR